MSVIEHLLYTEPHARFEVLNRHGALKELAVMTGDQSAPT